MTAPVHLDVRRSLTIASDNADGASTRSPVNQSRCLLLSTLPPELRQKIWRNCLGGMTLHLEFRDRRLCHILCLSPTPGSCDTFGGAGGCWQFSNPDANHPKRHLLSILLSCRQIYSEAIYHLYADNDFVTIYPEFVHDLPQILRPQRINAIRSLRFKWYNIYSPPFPSPFPGMQAKNTYWTTIWKNLADMKDLRKLRVKLIVGGPEWEDMKSQDADALLEPITAVTTPKNFELSLPFENKSDNQPWESLPCRIRRTSKADTVYR